jgi:hypothetical protein
MLIGKSDSGASVHQSSCINDLECAFFSPIISVVLKPLVKVFNVPQITIMVINKSLGLKIFSELYRSKLFAYTITSCRGTDAVAVNAGKNFNKTTGELLKERTAAVLSPVGTRTGAQRTCRARWCPGWNRLPLCPSGQTEHKRY